MATKKSTGGFYKTVSDEAMQKSTGKTWPQWLKALDGAGCKKMNHKQIVAVVHEKHGIGPWWQQMVTVGYEQARDLREVHQKTDGYSFSISRTIPVSANTIFNAWTQPKIVARWLNGEKFEITTSTRGKSIRLRWPDQTRVSVMLYPKSDDKAQVVIEHLKIPNAAAMKKLKSFWTSRVDELQAMLTN